MKSMERRVEEHVIDVPNDSSLGDVSFEDILFVLGISPSNHTYYSFFEKFAKKYREMKNSHFLMNSNAVIDIGHHYSSGFKIAKYALDYIFRNHNRIRKQTGEKEVDMKITEAQYQVAVDSLPEYHNLRTKRDRKKLERNKNSTPYFLSKLNQDLHVGEGKSVRDIFIEYSEKVAGVSKDVINVFNDGRMEYLKGKFSSSHEGMTYTYVREVYLEYFRLFYEEFVHELPSHHLDEFLCRLQSEEEVDCGNPFTSRVLEIGRRQSRFIDELGEVDKLIKGDTGLRKRTEERLRKHFLGSHKHSKEVDLAIQIANAYFFPPKYALQRGKAKKGINRMVFLGDFGRRMLENSTEYFIREVKLDIIHFLDLQLVSGLDKAVYLYPMEAPSWEKLYRKYAGAEYWEVVKKMKTVTSSR